MRNTYLLFLACGSALVAAYAVEICLHLENRDHRGQVARAAARAGVELDTRTVAEVVEDLRDGGIPAHPFFRLISQGKDLMPIGNTPNRTIVFCNELGRYMVFRTDRHGFNNPDEIWDERSVDLVLLGDSFVQGACDPDGRGFADLLRGSVPSLLNLGSGSNEPQLNLATLIEYAVPMHPRAVLWFHYAGNDLSGMMTYRRLPHLRRYVEEEHSQDLIHRSEEIERTMEEFLSTHRDKLYRNAEPEAVLPRLGWLDLLRFPNLRYALGLTSAPNEVPDFVYFADVVERAASVARTADITLAFVVIPNEIQVGANGEDPAVTRTKEILQAAGFPVFDLTPVFRAAGEDQVFAFGEDGGHLSPKGNAIVAEFVRDRVLPRVERASRAARDRTRPR